MSSRMSTAGKTTHYVAPSRAGKVGITVYLDPDGRDQLKIAAIESGKSMQDMVEAAIKGILRKRGKVA